MSFWGKSFLVVGIASVKVLRLEWVWYVLERTRRLVELVYYG